VAGRASGSFIYIVIYLGCAWLIKGYSIGWLDLLTPYSHNSELQAIQRYH
jgi:hypothetical protein